MTVVGPFGLRVRDQALEADVQAGLAAVEAGLLDATKSEVPFITEAAQHLVSAGGKRFRPLLVMLASQFGDPDAPGVVPAAVVVELTHLATLYHDDVMDEADVRRGVESANTRWGNSVAVLTGDFLFARASHILADLGPEAVRIQAEAFERLVTGQILETAGPRDGRDPVDHYMDVLGGKTGSLVAVAGRFGAMMAGADESVVDILTQYGERLGIAFQLADDVLDIASDSHESGKTPGTDLREGISTLPVLHLRARAAAEGRPEDLKLVELLDGDLNDDARLAEALHGLRAHPALEQARRDTVRYAQEARAVLTPLPECYAKSALEELCDAVVHRAG
ncbi:MULTISPECIES: polyprenyl synthetase family protein [unclassified Streptomyces]|uniref:polyprenyl synthetase family protein n=1 Tax=Streptomyces TaxID=1883 RepID=UPI0001C197D9|nr:MULTISPECIES: polyprenyl synthetase family protein [unclassified Streptomyces]MYR66607.1 polyprenyl synthetase family protein [Streptomyces sp. SID4939]MYS04320.1 polyprenyl synthetase family protein [Streptomyces sp. SID4940]MYT61739.1 polyprenyl synthetase family protein [Streptomyces sp. SID8357]MYT85108.1 polyprenyl synthetase family protein [Streptomyces sp. SID8360]MYU32480.1 polyprenyl synthetase family protein [Streptomyces sp. SID8358]MYW39196.1 polyprenyl synthetase family protei